MKTSVIKIGTTCLLWVSSIVVQISPMRAQTGESVKQDDLRLQRADTMVVEDETSDSIRLYRQYIKEINKDTQKTVVRINRKISLLQTVVMRSSVASIWPDGRIIPPPEIQTTFVLPEPTIDSVPQFEHKKRLFRKNRK